MTKTDEAMQQIVDAALNEAAKSGWADLTLYEIAETAGLSSDEIYRLVSSKQDILNAFSRQIDVVVLSEFRRDPADSVRDRLFELIMARFDEMAPYRAVSYTHLTLPTTSRV